MQSLIIPFQNHVIYLFIFFKKKASRSFNHDERCLFFLEKSYLFQILYFNFFFLLFTLWIYCETSEKKPCVLIQEKGIDFHLLFLFVNIINPWNFWIQLSERNKTFKLISGKPFLIQLFSWVLYRCYHDVALLFNILASSSCRIMTHKKLNDFVSWEEKEMFINKNK